MTGEGSHARLNRGLMSVAVRVATFLLCHALQPIKPATVYALPSDTLTYPFRASYVLTVVNAEEEVFTKSRRTGNSPCLLRNRLLRKLVRSRIRLSAVNMWSSSRKIVVYLQGLLDNEQAFTKRNLVFVEPTTVFCFFFTAAERNVSASVQKSQIDWRCVAKKKKT